MLNNIPPKQTLSGMPGTSPENPAGYDHLPPSDPLAGGLPPQGLVIHDAAHGDASSFPVLKAFQDYLEMERQQARKRLVTLTAFFVSLMTLVVAGFIVAFIFMLSNASKNEDKHQARVDRLLEEALQQRKAPEAVAPVAQQVAKEFEAAAQNLQTNLSSQLATVGSVATRLDSKVEAQNAEMAKMRDEMAAMQKENARMRADLPKLALDAARKAPPPATSSGAPTATASHPEAVAVLPPTTTAGTPAAAAGKAPKGYEEAVLLIRSRDSDNNIPWRAFVPK
jgi:flagellar basal body-associated protein FliL